MKIEGTEYICSLLRCVTLDAALVPTINIPSQDVIGQRIPPVTLFRVVVQAQAPHSLSCDADVLQGRTMQSAAVAASVEKTALQQ